MDKTVKTILNSLFMQHYAGVYNTKPTLKPVEDTNYYYITAEDSNIICLLTLDYIE